MSDFKPVHYDHDVNHSKIPLWKEILTYGGGLLLLLVVLYFAITLLTGWIVRSLSPEQEMRLWKHLAPAFASSRDDLSPRQQEQEKALQALFARLPKQDFPAYPYKVWLLPEKSPNALAMPGGTILVTTGMLEMLTVENSLTFVLGHELGHFAGRDHLHSLGRAFVWQLLGMLLLGREGSLASSSNTIAALLYRRDDRQREIAADRHGLAMVVKTYGHAGGALEFFEILERKEQAGWTRQLEAWTSTHPVTEERINTIRQLIKAQGAAEKSPVQCAFCGK